MQTLKNNSQIPAPVLRVWQNREKIELEAAAVFSTLAKDLVEIRGENDPVAILARDASTDELRHAQLCRDILEIKEKPRPLDFNVQLGPLHLTSQQRVIYACLAMSCITETLSTALLFEMQRKAQHKIIRKTVREILKDEINHSRIGWAELARSTGNQDLQWLKKYIPRMIQEALRSEIRPMLSFAEGKEDYSEWGVLTPSKSKELMSDTISSVVLPGLKNFGIDINL